MCSMHTVNLLAHVLFAVVRLLTYNVLTIHSHLHARHNGRMTGITTLTSLDELNRLRQSEQALVLYFAGENCAVCEALWPKFLDFLQHHFAAITVARVQSERATELCGQLQVFAIPSVIVYFAGQEALRRSRSFSLSELQQALERPYTMLFGERR